MMDKSAFNVKLGDLYRYSMLDKTDIQTEKNRFPYCSLLQLMDLLSDKATDAARWEERTLPRVALYVPDQERMVYSLERATITDVHTLDPTLAKAAEEKAKSQKQEAEAQGAFDIMQEINAYQEVSFKTAPKSVILSNFLETGNYKAEDLGENEDVPVEVLGKKSIAKDESLETETLAIVLEKQGKFDRAIGIYEKLIAKYPEKSSTFALRISELQIKMENNKK